MDFELRWAGPDDYKMLGLVMFDAVHSHQSPYTPAQRLAWVPTPRNDTRWHKRLSQQDIIAAKQSGEMKGFMSVRRSDGYVDFAYIIEAARGQGLFRKLYEQIEIRAGELGHKRLWVHASLMAEPAFARMGFESLNREEVEIGSERLSRWEMEKQL